MERIERKVHDHGYIALVDCMPTSDVESAIVQAARVSYGKGTDTPEKDTALVRSLMRRRHTTPFEMVETKWHCRMPIFVARQWVRHRTASINEVSARYTELKDDFWIPESLRGQSSNDKQVSEGNILGTFIEELTEQSQSAYQCYKEALISGVGREMARSVLPLNVYTEWYWKIDLHNLFHFLELRLDSHAQQEIRDYAQPMLEILGSIAPFAVQAFKDYRLNAMTLSALEISCIRNNAIDLYMSKKEHEEFLEKRKRLGL